jgi:DNA-directed RNA polymerase subunit RPC12/RpoP
MILNPIKCENCGKELQPNEIMLKVSIKGLVKKCKYCGHEVVIKD